MSGNDRQVPLFPMPRRRAHGTPGTIADEAAARDVVLAHLEKTRADLVRLARGAAHGIAAVRGRVTSVDVFRQLRASGYGALLDSVDPRWMGAVFRAADGWRNAGWERTGSHGRPVAVWVRA